MTDGRTAETDGTGVAGRDGARRGAQQRHATACGKAAGWAAPPPVAPTWCSPLPYARPPSPPRSCCVVSSRLVGARMNGHGWNI